MATIGVFDSGSGGLTVLKEIRARLRRADIIYFGDLKNAVIKIGDNVVRDVQEANKSLANNLQRQASRVNFN